MCRIVGFRDDGFTKDYSIDDVIVAMRDSLSHGGPDDAGYYTDNENHLAFGHRRLSIIDLTRQGRQPMSNDAGSLWVSYNGEIYNFADIKAELEQGGRRFRSHSDTEVLIAAYEKWGIECVHKFRGMWAFAIWDKKNGEIILCRDRAGVKPLYWYLKDGLFMFGSELKAFYEHPRFVKDLDREAAAQYFDLGYIPAPYSIWRNVRKLRPGHFLRYGADRIPREAAYWNGAAFYIKGFESAKTGPAETEEETEEHLERLLIESFKLRMVSDVPVGVFLSGGVDSSAVAAILRRNTAGRLKTFTIGFEGGVKYNEAPYAKRVADYLGTDHTEHYFTQDEVSRLIPKIPLIYDEPFGDSSALPTYLVSTIARRHVKVALSADGGDELFCGYNSYAGPYVKLIQILIDPKIRKATGLLMKRMGFKNTAPSLQGAGSKINKMRFMLEIMSEEKGWDARSAMMCADFLRYLPDDILTKVDRATMSVALEGREPFLDNRLMEYVFQLPVRYKISGGENKHILRKILYKYIPSEMIERPKQGFSIPLDDAPYRDKLEELFDGHLHPSQLEKTGVVPPIECARLLGRWKAGKSAYTRLWRILCFQMWAEKYM